MDNKYTIYYDLAVRSFLWEIESLHHRFCRQQRKTSIGSFKLRRDVSLVGLGQRYVSD